MIEQIMRKKTKILFITNTESRGGAQQMLSRLYKYSKIQGYDSSLIFLFEGNDSFKDLGGISIVKNDMFKYLKVLPLLLLFIYKKKPGIIISFLPLSNILAQTAGFICRVKYRIASQRNPSYTYGSTVRFLDKIVGTIGVYKKNVMISNSSYNSFKNYPKNYKKKVEIIHNGIETKISQLSKIEARLKFKLPDDKTILVNTGRLVEQKNQKFLLELMPYLDNSFHLVIAGRGKFKDYFESLIEDENLENKVSLLGFVKSTEVVDLLQASDIFLFPSIFEGFGNSLLEALSVGLPVITSDLDIFREILICDKYNAGVICDTDSPEDWIDEIIKIKSNINYRKELSANAIKRSDNFTLNSMLNKFLKGIE